MLFKSFLWVPMLIKLIAIYSVFDFSLSRVKRKGKGFPNFLVVHFGMVGETMVSSEGFLRCICEPVSGWNHFLLCPPTTVVPAQSPAKAGSLGGGPGPPAGIHACSENRFRLIP